jgi:hypothetical protein
LADLLQVPWLVLLFSIITTGVWRFDQDHAQRFYDRQVTENLGLIGLYTATQVELETLPDIGPANDLGTALCYFGRFKTSFRDGFNFDAEAVAKSLGE